MKLVSKAYALRIIEGYGFVHLAVLILVLVTRITKIYRRGAGLQRADWENLAHLIFGIVCTAWVIEVGMYM